MIITSEAKRAAWIEVEQAMTTALAALVKVDEGQVDQSQLEWIRDKAVIQQQLWAAPVAR